MEQRATCRCTAVARSSSREQLDSSLLFIEKRRLRDRLLLLLPPRGCIDPCIKRRCTTTLSLPRVTYSEEFDREITLAGERERLLSPAPPLALSRPEITGLTDSHGLETNAFVSFVGIVPAEWRRESRGDRVCAPPDFLPFDTNRSHFRSGSRQLTLGEQEQYRRPRRGTRGRGKEGTRRLKRWKSRRGNTQVAQAPRGASGPLPLLPFAFTLSSRNRTKQSILSFFLPFLSFFPPPLDSRSPRRDIACLSTATEFTILLLSYYYYYYYSRTTNYYLIYSLSLPPPFYDYWRLKVWRYDGEEGCGRTRQ